MKLFLMLLIRRMIEEIRRAHYAQNKNIHSQPNNTQLTLSVY